jgi:hypothetical protein
MIIVQIVFVEVEHQWYVISIYYAIGELLPLALITFVLDAIARHNSRVIHKNENGMSGRCFFKMHGELKKQPSERSLIMATSQQPYYQSPGSLYPSLLQYNATKHEIAVVGDYATLSPYRHNCSVFARADSISSTESFNYCSDG